MRSRQVGATGPTVSAMGLGCMGMSGIYGPADRGESLATVRSALEAGITLFDTGDFYGDGHNELLLRDAFREVPRDQVFIAVKFDGRRHALPHAGGSADKPPLGVKTFLTDSLQRLGVDYVDLYQPARIDPQVPIEETVGEMADLVKAGYVRYIGLSEVGAVNIRRAHAVHPISWVQIEYSLFNRGIEQEILPTARALGISIAAYGVLSRGLLSGAWSRDRVWDSDDKRRHGPRFVGQNLERNLALVENLRTTARQTNATVAQLALAWVLSRGDDVVPLVGARTPEQLTESLGALGLDLSTNDLAQIEAAAPPELVLGEYYPVPREKWFK